MRYGKALSVLMRYTCTVIDSSWYSAIATIETYLPSAIVSITTIRLPSPESIQQVVIAMAWRCWYWLTPSVLRIKATLGPHTLFSFLGSTYTLYGTMPLGEYCYRCWSMTKCCHHLHSYIILFYFRIINSIGIRRSYRYTRIYPTL